MRETRKAKIRHALARRARFRDALTAAGLSQAQWARVTDITPAHLSMVLSGERDSAVLWEKIEAFTAKYDRTRAIA